MVPKPEDNYFLLVPLIMLPEVITSISKRKTQPAAISYIKSPKTNKSKGNNIN